MRSKITEVLVRHAPAIVVRSLRSEALAGITDGIRELDVVSGSIVAPEISDLRSITLGSGVKLIGQLPTKLEIKLVGWLTREKNLAADYSKVLIDAVTRYVYPHMATPIISMRHQRSQRWMFHPQHQNLVQEDESIGDIERALIRDVFTPQPGWHVLDIGAYLGHGALWMSERVGATGKIICVEASPTNFAVIERHRQINNAEHIVPHNAAIWHTAGEYIDFTITNRQQNAIHSDVVAGENQVAVITTSIPVLSEILGRVPDLVSLTVNGAEVESLESLRKISSNSLPRRIIAPGWYPKDGVPRSRLILRTLEELGYRTHKTPGNMVLAWQDSTVGESKG